MTGWLQRHRSGWHNTLATAPAPEVMIELDAAAGRVAWVPDATLHAVIDGWPRRFGSARAARLGLAADADADEIVRHFLHDIGKD